MLKSPEKKKSMNYANIDMDKFKFDFNLFVPNAENGSNFKEEKLNNN